MARARKPKEAPVVELVEVYRDGEGTYRWRGLAGNGKIVSDSAEGYNNRSYAKKMAKSLNASAKIVYVG